MLLQCKKVVGTCCVKRLLVKRLLVPGSVKRLLVPCSEKRLLVPCGVKSVLVPCGVKRTKGEWQGNAILAVD